MDIKTKDTIKEVITTVILNNATDIEQVCVVLEQYVFEKKNEKISINRYFNTVIENTAFQHALNVAISYFQIKLNCMKVFNKTGTCVAVIFK